MAELAELQGPWHVSRSVCGEAEYAREYDATGKIVSKAVVLDDAFKTGCLTSLAATEVQELADYINFAMELDDGEAESLAIAKNRNLALVTDDRKTLSMARHPNVAVATMSTAAVLKEWKALNSANRDRLPTVILRIERLARFRPRSDSPDYAWWDSLSRRA